MAEKDVQKITSTHEDQFEFLVVSFDLTNAPSTFQFLINSIFGPILCKFVIFFLDDILVSSRSLQHKQHLTEVLTIL